MMTAGARLRFYQRHYQGRPHDVIGRSNGLIAIPDDIERREESSPCFCCESRGPCRHRPWMLAQ
jgi:hypothetical protein